MALPLPLLLLAGAAVLLMAKSGDDDGEGDGGDGGDGDATDMAYGMVGANGPGNGGGGLPYASINTSDTNGTGSGVTGSLTLGTKDDPIEYTGSLAIIDAPVLSHTAIDTWTNQNFHLGDSDNEWLEIDDLVEVEKVWDWMHPDTHTAHDPTLGTMDQSKVYYPGNRKLIIRNRGSAPGEFSVDWGSGWAGDPENTGKLWFRGV